MKSLVSRTPRLIRGYVTVTSNGRLEVDGRRLFADESVRRQIDLLNQYFPAKVDVKTSKGKGK